MGRLEDPCQNLELACSKPDIHVDLVKACAARIAYRITRADTELGRLQALQITARPVREMRLQSVSKLVQPLHACTHTGEALNHYLAGLSRVRLIGHARHESVRVLDVQPAPQARFGRREDCGLVWVINAGLFYACEGSHARCDRSADILEFHALALYNLDVRLALAGEETGSSPVPPHITSVMITL